MAGVRFADVQSRPAEFLNLTSLTLEEFQVLVAPFETAFQGRHGASMANPEPVHGLSDLPAGNAGRSAVLRAHLPEDRRGSSDPGTAVRHGPEQSQSVDPCPAAGVARGAAHPRRCPRPLPRGSRAPAGCLGRGARAAGGAFVRGLASRCTRPWAGLPPCMGLLMSSAFQFSLYILPIPMFDRRDHPSVPTMMGLGHGGGRRSRMA